jgi:hypothetical protein
MELFAAMYDIRVTSRAVITHTPELVWAVEGRNVKGDASVLESVVTIFLLIIYKTFRISK